jgi:hypothetical protein
MSSFLGLASCQKLDSLKIIIIIIIISSIFCKPKNVFVLFQGGNFSLLQTYKTKEWTSWKKINKKFKQNHFCLVFSLWWWLVWGTKIPKEFCCFFSTSKAFSLKVTKTLLYLFLQPFFFNPISPPQLTFMIS